MPKVLVMTRSFVFLIFCCATVGSSAETFDFGRVRVGESQNDTLVIPNGELVALMVHGLSLLDSVFVIGPDPFTGDVGSEPLGGGFALPVVFSPKSLGVANGQFKIKTEHFDYDWKVTGLGVEEVIVFNEVLADPPPGMAGDANVDGVRSSTQDEFVELLNTGNYVIDIGGWELFDAGASKTNRFRFPERTFVEPGERVVVYGGGEAKNSQNLIFWGDGKIGGGLRNSGDALFLANSVQNDTVASMTYGSEGGRNQSLVRNPEGIGEWTLHTDFSSSGAPFSPGVKSNDSVVLPTWLGLKVSNDDSLVLVGDEVGLRVEAISSNAQQTLFFDEFEVKVSDSSVLKSDGGRLVSNQVGIAEVQILWEGYTARTTIQVVDSGDLNMDGFFTLWDVIRIVHLILNMAPDAGEFEKRSADLNRDMVLDIRDLMILIQRVVGGVLVSEKMTGDQRGHGKAGWKLVEDQIELRVPARTQAIFFKFQVGGVKLHPHAELGNIYYKQSEDDMEGIVLLPTMGTLGTFPATVKIRGVVPGRGYQWVALTPGGEPMRLPQQRNQAGKVQLLTITPNPLNPATVIRYVVESPQEIALDVYNLTGQQIREVVRGHVQSGIYDVRWDTKDSWGRAVGSGVYFVNLVGETNRSMLKMVVLR